MFQLLGKILKFVGGTFLFAIVILLLALLVVALAPSVADALVQIPGGELAELANEISIFRQALSEITPIPEIIAWIEGLPKVDPMKVLDDASKNIPPASEKFLKTMTVDTIFAIVLLVIIVLLVYWTISGQLKKRLGGGIKSGLGLFSTWAGAFTSLAVIILAIMLYRVIFVMKNAFFVAVQPLFAIVAIMLGVFVIWKILSDGNTIGKIVGVLAIIAIMVMLWWLTSSSVPLDVTSSKITLDTGSWVKHTNTWWKGLSAFTQEIFVWVVLELVFLMVARMTEKRPGMMGMYGPNGMNSTPPGNPKGYTNGKNGGKKK